MRETDIDEENRDTFRSLNCNYPLGDLLRRKNVRKEGRPASGLARIVRIRRSRVSSLYTSVMTAKLSCCHVKSPCWDTGILLRCRIQNSAAEIAAISFLPVKITSLRHFSFPRYRDTILLPSSSMLRCTDRIRHVSILRRATNVVRSRNETARIPGLGPTSEIIKGRSSTSRCTRARLACSVITIRRGRACAYAGRCFISRTTHVVDDAWRIRETTEVYT